MSRLASNRLLRSVAAPLLVLFLPACSSPPKAKNAPTQIGWSPVTTFDGQVSQLTESFNINTSIWRIRWEARLSPPEKKGDHVPDLAERAWPGHAPKEPEDEGLVLDVLVNSAVSGRLIRDAIHQVGPGKGIAYVTDDPRLYYLEVTSRGLNWTLAVDEGVIGSAEESP